MFLWSHRQAAFVLTLLVFYAVLLVHPAWRPWYEHIAPVVLILLAANALHYALRK